MSAGTAQAVVDIPEEELRGGSSARPPNPPSGSLLPLCVDLDGTLLRTDLLIESALALVKKRFLFLFLLPIWFLRGRAVLKREISRRVQLNAAYLPYRAALLEWLQAEHAAGRKLYLVTASDELLARPVAEHVGIFEEVYGSDGSTNLKSGHKRDFLVKKFGARGFVYAGDSNADLAIWSQAAGAVLVGVSPSIAAGAAALTTVTRTFPSERGGLKAFIKQIRVKQWVKNILVFVPVLAAHRIGDVNLDLRALVGFVSFSLCASAVYLANDLMDLEADRRHRSKKDRPFASGRLPLAVGIVTAPVFLVIAFGLALTLSHWFPVAVSSGFAEAMRQEKERGLSPSFADVLAIYFVVTNAYTFWLKREALLDVICLAGLYTLRIFAGAQSTHVPVSMWLLAFSMFAFLSLALVKRVSELRVAKDSSEQALHGRGYSVADQQLLSQAGITSGYMSVLVFALYLHGDEVKALYTQPSVLWFICPLILYWITRVWLLTHRGRMHDDPVIFAVRDRPSYLIGALALLVAYLAR